MRCLAILGRRRRDEAVDRRQEGGERLAAAGRGADQRVLAGGDVRPALSSCGFVGSGNDAANQARTAGENAARTG